MKPFAVIHCNVFPPSFKVSVNLSLSCSFTLLFSFQTLLLFFPPPLCLCSRQTLDTASPALDFNFLFERGSWRSFCHISNFPSFLLPSFPLPSQHSSVERYSRKGQLRLIIRLFHNYAETSYTLIGKMAAILSSSALLSQILSLSSFLYPFLTFFILPSAPLDFFLFIFYLFTLLVAYESLILSPNRLFLLILLFRKLLSISVFFNATRKHMQQ